MAGDESDRKKKHCSEVRLCSASAYLICPAYGNETNCWDTPGKVCCRRNRFERCKLCEVYLEAQGYSKSEIRKILLEIQRPEEYNILPQSGDKKTSD